MFDIKNRLKIVLFMSACLILQAGTARADLSQDVQGLVTQAQELDVQLKNITLNPNLLCGSMIAANLSAHNLVNSITQVNDTIAAPIQIDSVTLAAIDTLSSTIPSLASENLRLSLDLKQLVTVTKAITLKDGIVAMLQLSDDIGSMADRIGEMSDKILVMSDNIGLMADRIIVTQQLQSQNILLVQQGLLQSQTNALSLVSVVETSTNDLSLAKLKADGDLLIAQLSAIILNPLTMKTQLKTAASNVRSYLDEVKSAQATILDQSVHSTSYISTASLINQQNITITLSSIATVINGYTIAINSLKTVTSRQSLSDSLKSMLQMSADIGLMANRILEMGDVILAMSDNIGMVANQSLVAQQIQSANIATTQASVLATQAFAVTLIKNLAL
ncbi:MAG: hypothetical protein PHP95_13765 [Desulfuromonadaceae bacterium]|nr:hypothetical protein [Desulfuromonadaceae bacterium]MDD2849515.1 hypothetical protein [Desulfuromonadaceae bacterium]MDD4131941.1 hypothetical protein [Desulfuromonadaceae bacterium]